jgi:hypothetical protein
MLAFSQGSFLFPDDAMAQGFAQAAGCSRFKGDHRFHEG